MSNQKLMEIDITQQETKIANEEAAYIFGYLRKKYCNDNIHDLDIVLNSLCFSLLRMMHSHVRPKDRAMMIGIINNVLEKGILQD